MIINGFEVESEIEPLDFNEGKQKQLMEHQSSVLNDWINNKYFGIVKHATGSGKTITGISCIKEWLKIRTLQLF